jgi:glutathione peroxidase
MNVRPLLVAAGVFTISLGSAALVLAAAALGKDVIKEPTKMPAKKSEAQPASPLDFKVKTIDGQPQDLSQFKGKVVLFVNTASKCGLTPQYKGLQALYDKYKGQGLVIVGFPANNFGGQEPGTEAEIKQFCTSKYDVTFPMMSKISVKGDDKHPLYKYLTEGPAGEDFAGDVEWNFAKFLIDRNGNVIARFTSRTKPEEPQVSATIEKALAARPAAAARASN